MRRKKRLMISVKQKERNDGIRCIKRKEIVDGETVIIRRWGNEKIIIECGDAKKFLYDGDVENLKPEAFLEAMKKVVDLSRRADDIEEAYQDKRLAESMMYRDCCAEYVCRGSDSVSTYGSWKGKPPPSYVGGLAGACTTDSPTENRIRQSVQDGSPLSPKYSEGGKRCVDPSRSGRTRQVEQRHRKVIRRVGLPESEVSLSPCCTKGRRPEDIVQEMWFAKTKGENIMSQGCAVKVNGIAKDLVRFLEQCAERIVIENKPSKRKPPTVKVSTKFTETADERIAALYVDEQPVLQIAGSYRRGVLSVHDIDIVVIEGTPVEVLRRLMILRCKEVNRKVSNGEINKGLLYASNGDKINLELYVTTPESFGATMLFATGSKNFNVRQRGIAKALGLKLNQHGLFNAKEKRLEINTEEGIFKKLKMPFLSPSSRDK